MASTSPGWEVTLPSAARRKPTGFPFWLRILAYAFAMPLFLSERDSFRRRARSARSFCLRFPDIFCNLEASSLHSQTSWRGALALRIRSSTSLSMLSGGCLSRQRKCSIISPDIDTTARPLCRPTRSAMFCSRLAAHVAQFALAVSVGMPPGGGCCCPGLLPSSSSVALNNDVR